jgi:hypothetical protein
LLPQPTPIAKILLPHALTLYPSPLSPTGAAASRDASHDLLLSWSLGRVLRREVRPLRVSLSGTLNRSESTHLDHMFLRLTERMHASARHRKRLVYRYPAQSI